MMAMSVIVTIYTIVSQAVSMEGSVLVSVVIDSLWIGNAILGYKYAPHETTNYRSPPRKTRHKSVEDDE